MEPTQIPVCLELRYLSWLVFELAIPKEACPCTRLRYFWNVLLSARIWPNRLAILVVGLPGGEWRRGGIAARQWPRTRVWKQRATLARRLATAARARVGPVIRA